MKKIMIVEDNLDNMALITEILEDEGYDTIEMYDAESAISYLNENYVELILMDVSLPNMSGLEAVSILKKNPKTAKIPIASLTAHAMASDRMKSIAAGCEEHFTKPIDDVLIVETISCLLRENNG